MPGILGWLHKYPEFAAQYAQARASLMEKFAEEIVQISDDGQNDTQTDEAGRTIVDYDHIARSKLRVDTRKWLMARMAPKKYGDRLINELTGKDGSALTIEIVQFKREDTAPE